MIKLSVSVLVISIWITLIVAFSPEIEDKFKKCQSESKASDKSVKMAREHDFSFDSDERGKCFTTCLGKVLKVINSNMDLDATFFIKNTQIDNQKVRKIACKVSLNFSKKSLFFLLKLSDAAGLCNAVTGESECDIVYKKFQCFFKLVPEIPIDF